MKPEIEALLGGYSAGTLNEDEQRRLFEAALDDQEVFDALADEQPLRELLGQPAFRRELLEALEIPSLKDRLAAWLARPWPWLAGTAATAALVAGVLWLRLGNQPPVPGHTPGPGMLTTPLPSTLPGITPITRPSVAAGRAEILSRLFALPTRQAFGVDLHLDRGGASHSYRVGEGLRLGFKIAHESNVLVLEQAEGVVIQLFPSVSAPFPRAKAGVEYSVPPLGEAALQISPPTGPRAIRLIAFPKNVDPLSLSPRQLNLVERDLTIVESKYLVGN